MNIPVYIRQCDDKLCKDAKKCISECKTWSCKIEAGMVASYFCSPVGGSYIKWPDDWRRYPPIPPRQYPKRGW